MLATASAATLDGPIHRSLVVAPGVHLRVVEAGKMGARTPIVFIPGWSAGADIWQGQVTRFAKYRRVIAFDPRSQGESSKTSAGNTPEQRAVDLHALLGHEHLGRPVLVGWSQAVQDIAAYVLKFGTRGISGIVLVDAAVADGAMGIVQRPQQAASQFALFALYQSDQRAYLRGMFSAIISKPQPAGIVDNAITVAMKTPPSNGIAMLVADMFGKDRTKALAEIDCPVLIIASASSGELDRQKAEVEHIKDARVVEIQDSAHAVFLDQPARFAAALSEFLNLIAAVESHRSKLAPSRRSAATGLKEGTR